MVKSKTWIIVKEMDPENQLGLEYDRDTENEMLATIKAFKEKQVVVEGDDELLEAEEDIDDEAPTEDVSEDKSSTNLLPPGEDTPEALEVEDEDEMKSDEVESDEEPPNPPEQEPEIIELPCSFCDEVFDDTGKLVVHQEEVHMCHTKGCGFYGTIEELKEHIEEEATEADIDNAPKKRYINRFRSKHNRE